MKLKTLAVVLLGTLLLGACSQSDGLLGKLGLNKSSKKVVAERLKLDVKIPMLDSEQLWKSENYQGKPILIVIMAPWCPWCKRALPALDQTSQAYAGKVEVVGAFDGVDVPEIEKIKEEYQIKTKILYDAGIAIRHLHLEYSFPYSVLFDKDHRWVRSWNGYSDNLAEMYAEEIDKLLK